MTAKELKDSKYFQHTQDGEMVSEGYLFTEKEMAIFWSQLCKEQREMCEQVLVDRMVPEDYVSSDNILNAPEPEFE